MQFEVKRDVLARELAFVQGIVEKKGTIPVLSYLLVESVGESSLRISATDLDVTIRCDTVAESVSQQGSLCVDARKLFDIVRLLPDDVVKFEKDENDWTSIRCRKFKSRVAGISRDNFPELPSFKSVPLKLPASLVKECIDRTIFAITMEESRYTLSGGKVSLGESGLIFVSTDGHRLAIVQKEAEAGGDGFDVLVPKKTLAELGRLVATYEGDVNLGADENHIYFEVGSRLLISRRLSGQFPNYEMVLPKGNDKRLVVNAELFGNALRRVALLADEQSHAVRMSAGEGELGLTSRSSESGEADETIEADYSGEPVEIGFNAMYLLDFLSVIPSGQVAMEFKDSAAQVSFKAVGNDSYQYVVMPMRL